MLSSAFSENCIDINHVLRINILTGPLCFCGVILALIWGCA